jgi:hypothetical protein
MVGPPDMRDIRTTKGFTGCYTTDGKFSVSSNHGMGWDVPGELYPAIELRCGGQLWAYLTRT